MSAVIELDFGRIGPVESYLNPKIVLYHKSTKKVKDDMKRKDTIMRELSPGRVVTAEELEAVCAKYGFDFENTKISLLNHGDLLTIFNGIYYLKDYAEQKTGALKYSPRELLSLGMEKKGIKNWYFGLETALKMLNLTHEVFAVDYLVNDSFNRVNPTEMGGTAFTFRRLKSSLFFGLKESLTKNGVKLYHSDLEKTLLDMAYLEKRSGKTDASVAASLAEYLEHADRQKLLKYAKYYPKTVQNIVSEVLNES